MYFIDTARNDVQQFDFDVETGVIANGRQLASLADGPGAPDGLAVDVEGGVWVAMCFGGQVRRYEPSGKLSTVVTVPASLTTSVAFGGPDHRQLFITTGLVDLSAADLLEQPHAGSVFVCEPGVAGLPGVSYAG
jgi:sugar lactone lactonase YvrE